MPGKSFWRTGLGVYVSIIVLAGAAVTAWSLRELAVHPVGYQWYALVVLTLISGTAVLKIPGVPANFTISDTFTITAAVLYGPAAGTIAVAFDCLVISFRLARAGLPMSRVLFDATAPSLAMWATAHLLPALPSATVAARDPITLVHVAAWLVVFVAAYFLLNTGAIAVAVAFEKHVSPFTVWHTHFLGLWLSYFGGGVTAALVLLLAYTTTSNLALMAVLVPLPLVLYFAFKESMGRLDDQLRHLADVNSLYLSTIEALAHAIDAKDPFTHGHIRRVQMYAVRLAAELGITEEGEIKALEAAALLHDMGKIGVPEHILNKPGKLTLAEYEKVKGHASLGADILASIAFPYPLVPIVRHHHERWDGRGYPDGIRGQQIPLGARILAVADCFDALTSDRPYRRALSDEAAVQILLDERGKSYDPAVVDTFVRVYREVAVTEATPVLTADTVDAIGRAFHAEPAAADMQPAAPYQDDVAMAFFEFGQALANAASADEVGRAVWACVRAFVPASSCVVFLLDPTMDAMRPVYVAGENAPALSRMTIPLGHKLTGWVAANRSTLVNADALLDVADVVNSLDPPLHSCLSTAVVAHGSALGAVTLYSTAISAFADRHGRFVEAVADKAAVALGRLGAPVA